jgi:hypothetical protein
MIADQDDPEEENQSGSTQELARIRKIIKSNHPGRTPMQKSWVMLLV